LISFLFDLIKSKRNQSKSNQNEIKVKSNQNEIKVKSNQNEIKIKSN